jgi:glycosyltransferase involved in cell wall biosynthesis
MKANATQMTTNVLLSVIMPVYNGAEFLAEAVASITAQAYQPLEIIVVDDGSTDDTAAVAQILGREIRYLYQPNQGPAAARNAGLAVAQGDLIAFLDVDDLWPADKLAQQMACLHANAATEVVWGKTWLRPYQSDETEFPSLIPNWMPLLGSLLCRRAVFEQVGGFDPTMRFGEDMDWFIRLREQHVVIEQAPALGLLYRVRPGSLTYNKTLPEVGVFDIVRRMQKRRRDKA